MIPTRLDPDLPRPSHVNSITVVLRGLSFELDLRDRIIISYRIDVTLSGDHCILNVYIGWYRRNISLRSVLPPMLKYLMWLIIKQYAQWLYRDNNIVISIYTKKNYWIAFIIYLNHAKRHIETHLHTHPFLGKLKQR